MRRRTLLVGCSGLLTGLAGCGAPERGGSSEGTDTPLSAEPTATARTRTSEPETDTPEPETDTPEPETDTPEPTTRVERYRPVVVDAGLVSAWSSPGDLTENQIRTVSRGRPAIIALRYRVRLPAGSTRFREGVTVTGPDDTAVSQSRTEVERTTDTAGVHTFESAVTFETDEWVPGEYAGIIRVGNLELHHVSDPFRTTFRVEAD